MATRRYAGAFALMLGATLGACFDAEKETSANVDSALGKNVAPPAAVVTQDTSATGEADKPADSTAGEGQRLGRPALSGDTTRAKAGPGQPSTNQKDPRKSP